MPFLTALLAVSRVLRGALGEDGSRRKERAARKDYSEEFAHFFPTVLSTLVGRRTSIPRLTTAYDYLEKVRSFARLFVR